MSNENQLRRIMETPSIERPMASPTGEYIAFRWGCPPTLHVLDLETKTITAVGDGTLTPERFIWNPETENVLYRHQNGDETAIRAADTSGDTRQVQPIESDEQLWDISPDGQWLYTRTDDQMLRYELSSGQSHVVVEDVSFLTRANPEPGGCSPDRNRIAYTLSKNGGRTSYVAAADGSDPQELAIEENSALVRAWGPDSSQLLITESPIFGHVGVYDLNTDEVQWFQSGVEPTTMMPSSIGEGPESPVAFFPDGETILARRSVAWVSHPIVYDQDGHSRELTIPGWVNAGPNLIPGGRFLDRTTVLFHRETETRPGDLLRYDVETDEIELLFEAGYGNADSQTIVTPQHVAYETADGGLSEAMVYDSGQRPSPAIVELYSPFRRPMNMFSTTRNVHYLVSEGYTVVKPLHSGGHLTAEAHANKAAAGRWVRSQDWIDEKRVGVLGHSHGAHEVYMQLVRYPEVWDAGVAIAGFPDLLTLVEDGEGPPFLQEFLGDPTENEETWIEQSPIEHVGGLALAKSFPLLVVHPEQDMSGETERAFCDALAAEGWTEGNDFEYMELDQGHAETNAEERIERWQPIADFFNRRLQTNGEQLDAN